MMTRLVLPALVEDLHAVYVGESCRVTESKETGEGGRNLLRVVTILPSFLLFFFLLFFF